MMRAEIVCEYEDESVSKSVAAALQPDNLQAPEGVRVSTEQLGKRVVTNIEVDGRIETFLATIDDLLACTSTAESVI